LSSYFFFFWISRLFGILENRDRHSNGRPPGCGLERKRAAKFADPFAHSDDAYARYSPSILQSLGFAFVLGKTTLDAGAFQQ
jgi:hypothetical protein